MKKLNIVVIGRVADKVELLDGQTIKTKILLEELKLSFPEKEIISIDTFNYRVRMLSILASTVKAFFKSEHIFVLLSKNGRKFFFPIITGLNKIFHRKLYHDVIGGALPSEAVSDIKLRKQLQRFEVNWVEFSGMKKELEAIGVLNVEVLPNFKRLKILSNEQLAKKYSEPFVFTMFSRVVKEKGMDEAAKAIRNVNSQFGKKRAVLRIYGAVEGKYKEEFDELLDEYSEEVTYKGCVAFDKSVECLSEGYMLLFPSTYQGEGMPGTIIDAFSAGLPVIATDWHFNGELVINDVTGYCYDYKKPELLAEYIKYAVENPDEIEKMRKACLEEAKKYTPEIAMKQIIQRMK